MRPATGVCLRASSLRCSSERGLFSSCSEKPSRFSLAPAQGAPGLLAYGGQVTATELPVLTAQGGPPGGGGFLALTSVTPRPGMVVLGPIVPPTHFGLAGVYVNLAQPYALAAVGIVGPAGLVLAFSIPPSAALLGDTSCLQGVTFQPDGSIAGLSGPALLTVI